MFESFTYKLKTTLTPVSRTHTTITDTNNHYYNFIIAGQLASLAETRLGGPTGPFKLSVGFLAAGAALAALTWKENVAVRSGPNVSTVKSVRSGNESGNGNEGEEKNDKDEKADKGDKQGIADAVRVARKDKKILLVGGMQALFEGAMYIFVLQWCPAVKEVISQVGLCPSLRLMRV